jgi:predicted HicB family RNase H-like nuclease
LPSAAYLVWRGSLWAYTKPYKFVKQSNEKRWFAEALREYTSLETDMKSKSEILQIRVTDTEKEGFELAAALAGISVSSWVRERLRLTAIRELESAGRRVPFVPEITMGGGQSGRT